MACLTITLHYDLTPPVYSRGAATTLKAAQSLLRLLGAMERGVTKRRPTVIWDVNIYSLNDMAVLEFRDVGDTEHGRVVAETILARGLGPTDIAGAER